MIKTSEMYRISGGCMPDYKCSECANYIGEKYLSCIVYPKSYGTIWSGNRMACRYFRERIDSNQMDIIDLIKIAMK